MTFDELVKGFGEKIGVELAMEDGVVALNVDGMPVMIQELSELNAINILGEIGEPPPEGLETLLSSMLNANHLFAGTAGGTLSRDPENGKFFLCRWEPLALADVESFTAVVDKFVNVLETWRKILSDYRPSQTSAETAPEEAAPAFGSRGFMQI